MKLISDEFLKSHDRPWIRLKKLGVKIMVFGVLLSQTGRDTLNSEVRFLGYPNSPRYPVFRIL